MTALTHPLTLIDPVCGKPWKHARAVPVPLDPIEETRWEHIDGSPVLSTDHLMCDSCGRFPLEPVGPGFFMLDPTNYVPRVEVAP